jgi:hypothetical protein
LFELEAFVLVPPLTPNLFGLKEVSVVRAVGSFLSFFFISEAAAAPF